MKSITTKKITYTAIMIALVFVGTFAIRIPVPFSGGYIHPGDSMVFISGLILGPIYGALAAGIGSALSDLLGGYAEWVLPTLLIKAAMGYIVGYVSHSVRKERVYMLLSVVSIAIWAFFIGLSTYIINGQILGSATPEALVKDFDGITNVQELFDLATKVNHQLIWIFIGVPVLLIILSVSIKLLSKNKISFIYSLSFAVAGMVMVIGYYLAYWVMYGNYIVPIFSIPANILQFIGGIFIAWLVLPVANRLKLKDNVQPTSVKA